MRRDGACAGQRERRAIEHRGVDGLVVKQGVALLQHPCKEARVGVEFGVEEERRGRAEGLRQAGFERCVSMVVYEQGTAIEGERERQSSEKVIVATCGSRGG